MTRDPIRFFLPGPTFVPMEVREAMLADLIGHRSEAMGELYSAMAPKLPPIFRTASDVYVATSSSTLVMQGAVQSTVTDRVLHLVCGAFSKRWYDISVSLGFEVDKIEVPLGQAIDPEVVRQALRRQRYEAVAFAHNETSAGVENPARDIARVVHEESDALVLVDAVSSMAGIEVECDEWGLDIALSGSQKAFSIPPGLTFFHLSDRAIAQAEKVPHRGFYTDLLRYRDKHLAGGTITTPAISTIYAADVQLGRILDEGIENRWARHHACHDRVTEWVAGNEFEFYAETHRSPTVSCLTPPKGLSAPAIFSTLAERGWTIGTGYGPLKPHAIRIGHMGEVTLDDLNALLAAIDEIVAELS